MRGVEYKEMLLILLSNESVMRLFFFHFFDIINENRESILIEKK